MRRHAFIRAIAFGLLTAIVVAACSAGASQVGAGSSQLGAGSSHPASEIATATTTPRPSATPSVAPTVTATTEATATPWKLLPTQPPSATASLASDLTVTYFGDGFFLMVPASLQRGFIPGDGLDRWEDTRDWGQRYALAIQTIRKPPANQRSLDGLAAVTRHQLAEAGVKITGDKRVQVPAGTAQRIAAERGGDWAVFYLFFSQGIGYSLQLFNLSLDEEQAIMKWFGILP